MSIPEHNIVDFHSLQNQLCVCMGMIWRMYDDKKKHKNKNKTDCKYYCCPSTKVFLLTWLYLTTFPYPNSHKKFKPHIFASTSEYDLLLHMDFPNCLHMCSTYRDTFVNYITQRIVYFTNYRKMSNISRTWPGNEIVDHSDVVGASLVGAAPTTSLFST